MRTLVIVLALTGLMLGCHRQSKEGAVRLQETNGKTYCLGRHTFFVPEPFVPSTISTGNFREQGLGPREPIFEVEVRDIGLTHKQFRSEIEKRRTELVGQQSDRENILRDVIVLGEDAVLFRVQEMDDVYVSEVYVRKGTALLKVTLDSFDRHYEAAEQRLRKFVSGANVASQGSTMQANGFCLGPLVVAGDFNFESASFLFRDGRGEDLQVDINSGTGKGKEEPSLLERMSSPDPILSKIDLHETVLRKRKLSVAGMQAEEWLEWTDLGREHGGKKFGFALETIPRKPASKSPFLTLSFDSAEPLADGTNTQNWMSDEAAVHLWDSVVKSIRLASD